MVHSVVLPNAVTPIPRRAIPTNALSLIDPPVGRERRHRSYIRRAQSLVLWLTCHNLVPMKESNRVLLALAIGVLGGIAIAASHSASLLGAADFIAPIGTLWVNAIRMTVIPLVISLLITGVASVSDIRAVGRLGGRTIVVFLLLLAIVAIVVIPVVYGAFAFLPKHIAPPPTELALDER